MFPTKSQRGILKHSVMTGNNRQSASHTSLSFFASEPHQCSYLPDQQALTVFADPYIPMTNDIYSRIIEYGFRRSGKYVYSPKCTTCNRCISVRVAVDAFSASRNQRRTWKRNADVRVTKRSAKFIETHFQLYQRYIQHRHVGGGMENPTPEDYMKFLTSDWSNTWFYEFHIDSQLMAVAVADHLTSGISAVYTFYQPEFEKRSPGSFAILWLIEQARLQSLRWVYLGYYIADCQKMNYKDQYRPLEAYINGQWQRFIQGQKISD